MTRWSRTRRQLTLAATCATALAGPLAAQALRVPHETFTLPNGLTVLVHEDRSVPVVGDRGQIEAGIRALNEGPLSLRDLWDQELR